MKRYRGRDGTQRLWFESAEIEEIMVDELRKGRVFPLSSNLTVDIEALIEEHLCAQLDQYADLEPGVLGVTEFGPPAPPKVSINRDLTGSALDEDETPRGILGRWRATLAHEAAHIILHRGLFEIAADEPSLFAATVGNADCHRLFRCLKRDVAFASGGGDWREIQANRGMAALLMPLPLFLDAAREEVGRQKFREDELVAGAPGLGSVVARLSNKFKVSRQAAAIRLESSGVVSPSHQGRLT